MTVLIRRLCQDVHFEANLVANLPPRPPLVLPAEHSCDRTQTLFVDLGLAFGGRQIELGFLDVGRELVECHDLAHAWLRYVSTAGEFDRI